MVRIVGPRLRATQRRWLVCGTVAAQPPSEGSLTRVDAVALQEGTRPGGRTVDEHDDAVGLPLV